MKTDIIFNDLKKQKTRPNNTFSIIFEWNNLWWCFCCYCSFLSELYFVVCFLTVEEKLIFRNIKMAYIEWIELCTSISHFITYQVISTTIFISHVGIFINFFVLVEKINFSAQQMLTKAYAFSKLKPHWLIENKNK